MQDKPIRCAYAYATTQPIASNAIYQRGRYYVTDNTGKKDKYRYNIFFSDLDGGVHLLGLTGTIDNAKRYTNSMYHVMPMAITLAETQTEQAEKLGKKYRVRLRPEKKEKQIKDKSPRAKASPKAKAKAQPKPKAQPKAISKAKAEPKPKAQPKPKAEPKPKADWRPKFEKIKRMPVATIANADKALQALYNFREKYMDTPIWITVQNNTNEYYEYLKKTTRDLYHAKEYKRLYDIAIKAKGDKAKQDARNKINVQWYAKNINEDQYKRLLGMVTSPQNMQTRLF